MKPGPILLLKLTLFLLVAPGTMIVYLPAYLRHRAGEPLMPMVAPWHLLLLVPALFLFALLLRCVYDFAVAGRGTPAPIDPPKELVIRGPYRFTRNPMYLGVVGINLLQALLFLSPVLAVYTSLLLLGFHLFVTLYEEPSLRKRFGASYEEYCRAVPRWFRIRPPS